MLFLATLIVLDYYKFKNELELMTIKELRGIGLTLREQFNVTKHEKLVEKYSKINSIQENKQDSTYSELNELLRKIEVLNELKTPIYTLRIKDEYRELLKQNSPSVAHYATEFIITSASKPYFRHDYIWKPEMANAFFKNEVVELTPFDDENGSWVSVYIPLLLNEEVVAILELDRKMDDLYITLQTELIHRILTLIIVLIILIWLFNHVGNKINTPLNELTEQIKSFEKGDYILGNYSGSHDEIGRISKYLDSVIEKSFVQQAELYSAIDETKKANGIKAEFLANVSHELRTPLNAILGYSKLLSTKDLDEECQDSIRVIGSSGESLLSLINDFLDFTKIESGELVIESIDFNIHDLINELVDMYSLDANAKGIELKYEPDEKIQDVYKSDQGRIRQILMNLLDNAVKFTFAGKVIIRINSDVIESKYNHYSIKMSIEDTGIGMNAEVIDQLFKPFTQGDSSATRQFGGTGLGLSICQKLSEAMGGDISVCSGINEGSKFIVSLELPGGVLKCEKKEEESTKVKDSLTGCNILLVEDNPINQKLAAKMLKRNGAEVDVTYDGLQAVNAVKKAPSRYDIILMDRQMPTMDGVTATKIIIETYGEKAPKIIALTANVYKEQREEMLNAGMVAFLNKPINEGLLCNTINEFR